MRTYRIRQDAWTVLAGILHANEEFNGKGMTGRPNVIPTDRGWMPHEEWQLLIDRHEVSPIQYAVFSYDTIIGYKWDGEWYIPDVKYSFTTTNHQIKLRVAVDY